MDHIELDCLINQATNIYLWRMVTIKVPRNHLSKSKSDVKVKSIIDISLFAYHKMIRLLNFCGLLLKPDFILDMTIDKHYYGCQALRFSVFGSAIPYRQKMHGSLWKSALACVWRYGKCAHCLTQDFFMRVMVKLNVVYFIQRGKRHLINHPTWSKLYVKGSVLRVTVNLATTQINFLSF